MAYGFTVKFPNGKIRTVAADTKEQAETEWMFWNIEEDREHDGREIGRVEKMAGKAEDLDDYKRYRKEEAR